MKSKILIAFLGIALLVGACAAQTTGVQASAAKPTPAAPAGQENPGTGSPAVQNPDGNTGVPSFMELALGLLKLEGTTNALTQTQAEALLPLWADYQALLENARPQPPQEGQSTSSTDPQPPAGSDDLQKQLDDIVAKIKAQLTSAQLQAIADMKITRESAEAIMEDLGITIAGPEGAPQGNPPDGAQPGNPAAGSQQGNPPQGAPQGNPPSGEPQGQNGGAPQGNPPTEGQPAVQPGSQGQPGRPGMGFIPPELWEKLVDLLETRSGS